MKQRVSCRVSLKVVIWNKSRGTNGASEFLTHSILLGTSREKTPSKMHPPSTQSFCSWPTICFTFFPTDFPHFSPQLSPKALLVLSAPPFGQPLRRARDPGLRWAPLGQRLAACEGRRSGSAAGAGAGTGQLGKVEAGMGKPTIYG